MLDWFSIHWFLPGTLESFEWGTAPYHVYYLYSILLLPLLYILRWLAHFSNRQKIEIAMLESDARPDPLATLRHLPNVLMLFILALLIVALARPQRNSDKVEQSSEGIDIMLVLDISESMGIEDLRPNRLAAAKEVARKFVEGRFRDRIGIVLFAGDAFSLSPLTTDYDLLISLIGDINFGVIQQGGTAIGTALGVATNRMRESEAVSKVIILLSDGDNTAGTIDPLTAAELASKYDCKLYTIGIGRDGKVPYGTDLFGNVRYIEETMDETTLRRIAEIGSGQYFRATSKQALSEIFSRIDRYEKSEIKESRYTETRDYYQIYLTWAIILLLLWMLLKNTFIANALED